MGHGTYLTCNYFEFKVHCKFVPTKALDHVALISNYICVKSHDKQLRKRSLWANLSTI